MVDLKGYLLKVLNEYQLEKRKDLKNNQLAQFIRHQASNCIPNWLLESDSYRVMASCGQGQWAEVPWLILFDNSISVKATEGYYIVYLFRSDSKGVYISLNQGYTFYQEEFKSKQPKLKVNKVSKYWMTKLNLIKEGTNGFTTKSINLHVRNQSSLPKGYELGNIYSKYYSVDDLKNINNDLLLSDLNYMKSVLTELRISLPKNHKEVIYDIIENNSIPDLEEEILDKNYDTEVNISKMGIRVDVPENLKLNKIKKHGFFSRKRSYLNELDRNTKQGNYTEKLVLEMEKKRLLEDPLLKKYTDKVIHVALSEGDGLGYDILPFIYDKACEAVVEYYIEVKSTTGDISTPFFMSENELQVAKMYGSRYAVYRLYKTDDGRWNYYIINDPYRNTEYTPIQYMVIPKTNFGQNSIE